MRLIIAIAALLFTASAVSAEQFKNVSEFDATLLVGKTCRGTFSTGNNTPTSKGAMHAKFYAKDGELAVHYWRRFGEEAYRTVSYETGSLFEDLGEGSGFTVKNGHVHFVTNKLSTVDLDYKDGNLVGWSDPTTNPALRNNNKAQVHLSCN